MISLFTPIERPFRHRLRGLAGMSTIVCSESKAVSPPAAPALASYFLAPQEVTKKRCRATPPILRLLTQPSARCPAFLATNGRFRTRSLAVAQTCGTGLLRSRLRYSAASTAEGGRVKSVSRSYFHLALRGHPICLEGVEKRRAGRKKARRMSERPKGASSARPARTEHRRGPGAAGRRRGMSGFAYFCRVKSRSHQPAKPAAKRLLTCRTAPSNTIGEKP